MTQQIARLELHGNHAECDELKPAFEHASEYFPNLATAAQMQIPDRCSVARSGQGRGERGDERPCFTMDLACRYGSSAF